MTILRAKAGWETLKVPLISSQLIVIQTVQGVLLAKAIQASGRQNFFFPHPFYHSCAFLATETCVIGRMMKPALHVEGSILSMDVTSSSSSCDAIHTKFSRHGTCCSFVYATCFSQEPDGKGRILHGMPLRIRSCGKDSPSC